MQAGRAYAHAIPADVAGGPLSPWHAETPASPFLTDHWPSTLGNPILIRRGPAGGGQPHG
jgi:hypothetical protein